MRFKFWRFANHTVFCFLLAAFFVSSIDAQPIVTSFSPTTGPIGTTVIITGQNFDTTAVNNIVFFGAVKASVLSSNTTTITVTVPFGATYQPITVTTNNLTAYSRQRFNVTFPTINTKLTDISFTPKLENYFGGTIRKVSIADFDGDGKPDIAFTNQGNNFLQVARNTGTKGNISFNSNIGIGTLTQPFDIATGDINGDGKPDIVVSIFNGGLAGSVSIYRNTSTSGTLAFATPITYATGNASTSVSIGDLSGDGKPDIVVANSNSYTLSIFRNTTMFSGAISFAPKTDFSIIDHPDDVRMADYNGDGKTDLATVSSITNSVSVYKNIGSIDTIIFAPKINFSAGNYASRIVTGDIDRDGKDDIAVANYTANTISILRNTSTSVSISFADQVSYQTGLNPISLCITDLNGDGKPDISIANQNSEQITVLENQGQPGSLIFSKINYTLNASNTSIEAGDFDGDGKPEIAETNSFGVSILRNRIDEPVIKSFNPTAAESGAAVTITGKNFTAATSVKFGNRDALSFTIVSDSMIAATVGDGVSGQVTVTTSLGTGILSGFTFAGPPVITSFTPTEAAEGRVVLINGNNFGGAISVTFGGVQATNVTVRSDTVITATVGAGATGSVSVSTMYGTGSLLGFTYIPIPRITSFNPAFGPIGTTVTISGKNFDPIPANNIVYFGPVRASVLSATANSLGVTVPVGATFQPITVARNKLSSTSRNAFYVTFPGSDTFKTTSFVPKIDFTTGTYPRGITAADFDGDGKADLAVVNNTANSISLFKNTGTTETITFAPKVDYQVGTNPMNIISGDVNSDGKLDIVVGNYGSNTVSVFINTSTAGQMSFAQKIDYTTSQNPVSVAIADMNNDGKPDIIALNNNSNSVSVIRNTTINETASFGSRIDFQTGDWPQYLATGDIDGDGKLDIVVANFNANTISVLRNISVNGSISLAPKIDYNTGTGPFQLAIGDLDGNLNPEIVVSNSNGNTISVFTNNSFSDTISLSKIDIATGIIPFGIAIGNLDGNTKPDLAISDFGDKTVSLFNNTTNANGISLQSRVAFQTGTSPRNIAIADYDGDGKPDLAVTNSNSNTVSIFRNRIGETYKADLCQGGSTQITSTVTATTYHWQVDTGTGFSNINDNSNYTGTGSITLRLSNVPSSWYGYQYRCLTNIATSESTSLRIINSWKGSVNGAWEDPSNWLCGLVPDANMDVIIGAGSVVVSSNASCRSVKTNPATSCTVTPGYTLTITK